MATAASRSHLYRGKIDQRGNLLSPTIIVSVCGIVVAALVALYVSYAQRRQMRQIELRRTDPTIPLRPPPSPPIQWVLRQLPFILMLIASGDLVSLFLNNRPVSKSLVLGIVLDIIQIIFWLLYLAIKRIFDSFLRYDDGITRALLSSATFTKDVAQVVAEHEKRLQVLEEGPTSDSESSDPQR